MQDVQYYHETPSSYSKRARISTGFTIALEVPSKELYKKAVEALACGKKASFRLGYGKARLHRLDVFSKRVGRETALANMAEADFEITETTVRSDGTSSAYLTHPRFGSIKLTYREGNARVYFRGPILDY